MVMGGCDLSVETDDSPLDLASDSDELTNSPVSANARWSVLLTIRGDGGGITYCSGVALTENWIITSAHCVDDYASPYGQNRLQVWTSSGSSKVQVYPDTGAVLPLTEAAGPNLTSQPFGRASMYPHPDYDGSGDRDDDIGLIRLYNGGMTRYNMKARIYTDDRRPWSVWDTEDGVATIIGWGLGSGPGSDMCNASSLGVKREARDAFDILRNKPSSGYSESIDYDGEGLTSRCPGDSGAPVILHRGGKDLTVALHSGPESNADGAGTLIRPKMGWITSLSAAKGIPLSCPGYTTGGYAFRLCHE